MYYLSKLVWLVLVPSNASILLVFIGLGLCWSRYYRSGRRLALAGACLLIVFGILPTGTLLMRVLEKRFPVFVGDGRPVAGILVLGGALDAEITAARDQIAVNDAGERIIALVSLARRYPAARLAFTGGAGDLTGGPETEADMLEKHLPDILPGRTMEFERQSRNTAENAQFSFDVFKPQPGERWLLVTSAWHMPRAMGIFRTIGWDMTAYPVDFRSAANNNDFRLSNAMSYGLRRSDLAIKELSGLLFARLSGGSRWLFPASSDAH
jgi:uncharacterized SAM-binding protein YcdF (DUF218 family)